MHDRVNRLIGTVVRQIWMGTFHAACVRMLREHGDEIGLDPYFVIFDREMQDGLIAECMRDMEVSPSRVPVWFVRDVISAQKSMMKPLDRIEFVRTREGEIIDDPDLIGELRELILEYQRRLESYRALDFDDILLHGVRLLRESEEAREEYRSRISHILVDEFQDINLAQYELLRLLAGEGGNVTAVADEDQSIYSWRGSSPRFIDSFIEEFDPEIVELRENYRSTSLLLQAAQEVIKHNDRRRKTELFTRNPVGRRPIHYVVETVEEEMKLVAGLLRRLLSEARYSPGDIAIFYRRHRLADELEEELTRRGFKLNRVRREPIPSETLLGKLISLLRFINWGLEVDLERALNLTGEVVGGLALAKLRRRARLERVDLVSLLRRAGDILGPVSRRGIEGFLGMVEEVSRSAPDRRAASVGIELFKRLEHMRSPFDPKEIEFISEEIDRLSTYADLLRGAIERGGPVEVIRGRDIDGICAAEIIRRTLSDYLGVEVRVKGEGEEAEGFATVVADGKMMMGEPGGLIEVETSHPLPITALMICQKLLEYEEVPSFEDVTVCSIKAVGDNPRAAEIVEMAALKLDERGREVDRFYTLVRPKSGLPRSAAKTLGLTDEDLRGAPEIEKALPELLSFIGEDIIALHDPDGFGEAVLRGAVERHTGEPLGNLIYNAAELAGKLFPRESRELWALAERLGLGGDRLVRAYREVELVASMLRRLEGESAKRRAIEGTAELLPYAAIGAIALDERSGICRAYIDAASRYLKLRRMGRDELRSVFGDELLGEVVKAVGELRRMEPEERAGDAEWNELKSELMNRMIRFELHSPEKSLSAFLDYQSLLTGVDEVAPSKDRVTLMTLHSAKGTEFPVVIILGVEEGELPLYSEPEELVQEERRLFYVGMTRAKERLYLITALRRYGEKEGRPSRFVEEIPSHLIERHRIKFD